MNFRSYFIHINSWRVVKPDIHKLLKSGEIHIHKARSSNNLVDYLLSHCLLLFWENVYEINMCRLRKLFSSRGANNLLTYLVKSRRFMVVLFSLIKFLSRKVLLTNCFNEAACALQNSVWTCTLFSLASFFHWVFWQSV